MNRTSIVSAIVLTGLGGCAASPKPAARAPGTPAPVVAEPPLPGTSLDPSGVGGVRYADNLKAYPVGRTIDPNDPNLMHEAHTVYRREGDSAWNLNPNAPTVVPLGPALAVADPARTPGPLPAELEAKIAQQNQLVATLIEQNEALSSRLAELGKEIAALRKNGTASATPNLPATKP